MGSGRLGDRVWEEVLVMMGSGWLGARVWWPIIGQRGEVKLIIQPPIHPPIHPSTFSRIHPSICHCWFSKTSRHFSCSSPQQAFSSSFLGILRRSQVHLEIKTLYGLGTLGHAHNTSKGRCPQHILITLLKLLLSQDEPSHSVAQPLHSLISATSIPDLILHIWVNSEKVVSLKYSS